MARVPCVCVEASLSAGLAGGRPREERGAKGAGLRSAIPMWRYVYLGLLWFGLYTILALPIPILCVEWRNRGLGRKTIPPNIDCIIQRGAIEVVPSANNSIDWCTIPETTNEYLV